jgi:hypothetical protein
MPRRGPATHHVVHNPRSGWEVKRDGGERASSHHDTKREAIDQGRQVSRGQGTELRIHNRGWIASSDSHGGDPNPPRG